MLDLLDRLSAADRLQLPALDAELRRLPRPLLDALWAGVDALDAVPKGDPTGARLEEP